jgi:hypothetical protein
MPDDALKPPSLLYEQDFALWAEAQARALREGRARDLDWDHLAEELESLGGSQRSEIRNRMAVLITHLLKWHFQPERRKYGWRATMMEQRGGVAEVIEDSPSLRRYPAEVLEKAYKAGHIRAVLETGLHEGDFPADCPYALEDILRDGFYPGPPGGPD